MSDFEEQIDHFRRTHRRITDQLARVIVGQDRLVREVLTCLLAGGHGLVEGVPGIGKTLLIRTLANALRLSFSRIQFTPDLMPTDITGADVLSPQPENPAAMTFRPGPIFAHLVLADEINRATPKTQSALLEAMQEQTVTVGGTTRDLPRPGAVLATQNPIDMEGTFPLPEAQRDRFLLMSLAERPPAENVVEILQRTTGNAPPSVEPVADETDLLQMQQTLRAVPAGQDILLRIARLVEATHAESNLAPQSVRRYVRLGASPRGAQAVLLASKAHALLAGRAHVAAEDARAVAHPALRHRLVLNFEARADAFDPDTLIDDALNTTEP